MYYYVVWDYYWGYEIVSELDLYWDDYIEYGPATLNDCLDWIEGYQKRGISNMFSPKQREIIREQVTDNLSSGWYDQIVLDRAMDYAWQESHSSGYESILNTLDDIIYVITGQYSNIRLKAVEIAEQE